MQLQINISDKQLFLFDIDHKNQRVILRNKPNEISAKPILTPNQRTYSGIEARLNHFNNTNKQLDQLMKDIKSNKFRSDSQYHLKINVL